LTLPPVAAVSTLMTIDAPYTVCWVWALVFGHAAAVRGLAWAWPIAGILVGIGILAKYTMALWLPSVGLFLLMSPQRRGELRRGGFWLACIIAALFCLPILYWNARNGWVTVRHVGWQAGVEQREGWRWLGPLSYIGGQAALLLGFWFIAWAAAIWTYRPWRSSPPQGGKEHEPSLQYLWWLSVPMFGTFLVASLKTTGQLNWPVTCYLSGGVLAAAWLDSCTIRWHTTGDWKRRALFISATGTAVLGVVLSLFIHFPDLSRPVISQIVGLPTTDRPLPLRRLDPTARLRGWRPGLAVAVDEIVASVRARGEEPIIAGGTWVLPGELGAYCTGHPTVYSIGIVYGDRSSQYDLWRPNPVRDPEAFLGRTFVLVGCGGAEVANAFDTVEESRRVLYAEGMQPIAFWQVTVARGFRGFNSADQIMKSARY
jgi:hypothetical protein